MSTTCTRRKSPREGCLYLGVEAALPVVQYKSARAEMNKCGGRCTFFPSSSPKHTIWYSCGGVEKKTAPCCSSMGRSRSTSISSSSSSRTLPPLAGRTKKGHLNSFANWRGMHSTSFIKPLSRTETSVQMAPTTKRLRRLWSSGSPRFNHLKT